jgi:hypothetical protein
MGEFRMVYDSNEHIPKTYNNNHVMKITILFIFYFIGGILINLKMQLYN